MREHVASLDGLRGIAVAAVVGYHLRPEWVPGGFLGVDLFFVLSGYLITSLLLEEHHREGRVDLLAFAGRRLRRLLPAVLVVVVAVATYLSAVDAPAELDRARRHGLGTLGYVANWVFIADGDSYFADFAGPSYFRHMWSLAIEEQFYLLWPVVFWLTLRSTGRRGLFVAAAGIATASIVWMAVVYDPVDASRAYFGTDTRIFQPLLGALAALALPLRGEKPAGSGRVAALGGVVWLGALLLVDDTWSGYYRGGAAALSLAVVLLVIGASTAGPLARVLAFRPLVALGSISYGVYLWHWPILLILRREGWSGAALDVAVVVATLGVSVVSLALIETPVRRGAWFSGWLPLTAGAGSIVLAGLLVVTLTRTTSPALAVTAEDAVAAATAAVAIDAGDLPAATEDLGGGEVIDDVGGGVVEPVDMPLTVVLVGDSSAWTLGGGPVSFGLDHGPFVSPFDPAEVTLLNLARKGYRLVPGATTDVGGERPRPEVDAENETWWRETIAAARPDVVVALFGPTDLQSRQVSGARIAFGSPEFVEMMDTALAELFGEVAETVPVVLLTTPPLIGDEMPQPALAEFFRAVATDRAVLFNLQLGAFAESEPGVTVADFASALCPGGSGGDLLRGCLTDEDGASPRYDGVHFTPQGAALAAEILVPWLRAAAVGADLSPSS